MRYINLLTYLLIVVVQLIVLQCIMMIADCNVIGQL